MAFTFTILIILSLFGSFSHHPIESDPALWWTIELEMSVKGGYEISRDQKQITGHYRFGIYYQGATERDNGDYILYQGDSRLHSFQWHETAGNRTVSLGRKVEPRIKLNYLVRKQQHIHIDFECYPVYTHFNRIGGPSKIILPSSAENQAIKPDSTYNRHVTAGSNQVRLPEAGMYSGPESEKVLTWEWRKGNSGNRQWHSVVLTLKITRKQSR